MTGRYREALETSEQQLEEADQYRLAFVLPLAYIQRARALRGLRRFREALDYLARAERDRETHDDHVAVSAGSVRIGTYLAMNDFNEALEVAEPSEHTSAAANTVAELIATRAVALACAERVDDARETAHRAEMLSSEAEPRLLAKLAAVIASIQEGSVDGEILRALFRDVTRSAHVDAFVTAYRGFPPLIQEMIVDGEMSQALSEILAEAKDLKLIQAMPPGTARVIAPSPLTPREKDVLALVSEGLRNREIAERLFISEVTVKAHVRNILRKLGARSRTHAVSLVKLED
jgi:DNA-binding NarL/FixJ family response regulator